MEGLLLQEPPGRLQTGDFARSLLTHLSLPSLKDRCLVYLASIAPVQSSSWRLIEASDPVGEQDGSDTTWPEPRAARVGGATFQGWAQHGGGRGTWQSGRDSLQ